MTEVGEKKRGEGATKKIFFGGGLENLPTENCTSLIARRVPSQMFVLAN